MFQIRSEAPEDGAAIESLLDRCFGADRHHKISYRYRAGIPPCAELCLVADAEDGLVGSIRYWPLMLEGAPALLLGPLAIDPARQGRGIGRALVFQSLDTAAQAGHGCVFLVGDEAYYRRFGFATAPASIVMPGEQPHRLQMRILGDSPPPPAGELTRWPEAESPAHAANPNDCDGIGIGLEHRIVGA